jgi:hypothetical protein
MICKIFSRKKWRFWLRLHLRRQKKRNLNNGVPGKHQFLRTKCVQTNCVQTKCVQKNIILTTGYPENGNFLRTKFAKIAENRMSHWTQILYYDLCNQLMYKGRNLKLKSLSVNDALDPLLPICPAPYYVCIYVHTFTQSRSRVYRVTRRVLENIAQNVCSPIHLLSDLLGT